MPPGPRPQPKWPITASEAVHAAVCVLIGCVLAGVLMALADGLAYSDGGGPSAPMAARLLARLGLFAAAGCALGVVAVPLTVLAIFSCRRAPAMMAPLIATTALLSAALCHEPIAITLSGLAERKPAVGRWLFIVAVYASSAASALLTAAVARALRQIERGRARRALLTVATLLVGAVALAWGDLTVLVALYARAHRLMEGAAWLLAAVALSLGCHLLLRRRPGVLLLLGAAAGLAVLWCLQLVKRGPEIYGIDEVLALSRRRAGYATRMRLRAALAQDFLRDPTHWQGAEAARVDRLKRRYDIATIELAAKWDLPRTQPALVKPEPLPNDLNLLVIYVDTLRADVAADPSVMPNVAALRAKSLSFEQAFTTASDTVSALPILTGGCYGEVPCRGDILALAHRSSLPSAIVMALSARRFLARHSPAFAFDDVIEIADYAPGKKVWGYGADKPSAEPVSRASLAWLDDHPNKRFMLWSFHFDVHNWMQLELNHLAHQAAQHQIVVDEQRWRYRAAAAGVDEAIGVLLRGLEERKLADRTAILLVSDHGEALGHNGHWQHAVYLWDTLIHVPLLLHIPGRAAASITRPVGHVDVAPTLAQLIDPNASLADYHGVPLHTDGSLHDLPLLLFSMRKDDLLRVGLISRQAPAMKLELPVDSVEPELYDLTDQGDKLDVREEHATRTLELLSELVTSPLFPRPEPDDAAAQAASAQARH